MTRPFLLIAFMILGACADRTAAPYIDSVPENTTSVEVLTITTRGANELGNFTAERTDSTQYFNNIVSIPPTHKPGEIELSYRKPDPSKVFVFEKQQPLAGAQGFTKQLRNALAKRPKNDREVVIYVHGYNASYTDSAFRAAQLKHDLKVPGVMVNYSWPSASNPLGYSHDRDSVLFARDGFEETLKLIRKSTNSRIVIVAHSMGGLLVMESLRQIEIAQPGWSKRSLGGVILVAPDISLDVFKQQLSHFDGLPQPFAIFSSQTDPALRLSSRVNAVDARLGNLGDAAELKDFPVTLVDVTEFSADGADKHFVPGTSPALMSILRRGIDLESAFSRDASGRAGILPGTAISVRKATRLVLSPDLVQAN